VAASSLKSRRNATLNASLLSVTGITSPVLLTVPAGGTGTAAYGAPFRHLLTIDTATDDFARFLVDTNGVRRVTLDTATDIFGVFAAGPPSGGTAGKLNVFFSTAGDLTLQNLTASDITVKIAPGILQTGSYAGAASGIILQSGQTAEQAITAKLNSSDTWTDNSKVSEVLKPYIQRQDKDFIGLGAVADYNSVIKVGTDNLPALKYAANLGRKIRVPKGDYYLNNAFASGTAAMAAIATLASRTHLMFEKGARFFIPDLTYPIAINPGNADILFEGMEIVLLGDNSARTDFPMTRSDVLTAFPTLTLGNSLGHRDFHYLLLNFGGAPGNPLPNRFRVNHLNVYADTEGPHRSLTGVLGSYPYNDGSPVEDGQYIDWKLRAVCMGALLTGQKNTVIEDWRRDSFGQEDWINDANRHLFYLSSGWQNYGVRVKKLRDLGPCLDSGMVNQAFPCTFNYRFCQGGTVEDVYSENEWGFSSIHTNQDCVLKDLRWKCVRTYGAPVQAADFPAAGNVNCHIDISLDYNGFTPTSYMLAAVGSAPRQTGGSFKTRIAAPVGAQTLPIFRGAFDNCDIDITTELTGTFPSTEPASVTLDPGSNGNHITLRPNGVPYQKVSIPAGNTFEVGSPTALPGTGATFTPLDVGKRVRVRGAGTGTTVTGAGAITTGTKALTVTGAAFTSADWGKLIRVVGAGAAGADLITTIAYVTDATHVVLTAAAGTTVATADVVYSGHLWSTIATYVDATHVTLQNSALTGVANVDFAYGTDDSIAWQNYAADVAAAGGGTCYGVPGTISIVSKQGTVSIGGVTTGHCLKLQSKVLIDLQNSTLLLSAGAGAATILTNNTPTSGGADADIGVINGVLDCDYSPATIEWGVDIVGVTRLRTDHLRVVNFMFGGFRSRACAAHQADELKADGGLGMGLMLGSTVNANTAVRYGRLRANNVMQVIGTATMWGGVSISCQLGFLNAANMENCDGSGRIVDPSQDLAIGALSWSSPLGVVADGGWRIFGASAGSVLGVTVSQIECKATPATAFWLKNCLDTAIGSYRGIGTNTLGANGYELLLDTGVDRCAISIFKSSGTGSYSIRSTTGHIRTDIGQCSIYNSNTVTGSQDGVIHQVGELNFSRLSITDDRGGGSKLSRAFNMSGLTAGATGKCQHFDCSGASLYIGFATSSYILGEPRLFAGHAWEGEITATVNATVFDVTGNNNIRALTDGTGVDASVVEVRPQNAAAALLERINGRARAICPTSATLRIIFGDAVRVTGSGAINIATNASQLTVTGGTFTAADVGKQIRVVGAGASGGDLITTIASFVSATVVNLTAAASTTVTVADVHYATMLPAGTEKFYWRLREMRYFAANPA
jgi:hypothetical protein